MVPLRSKLASQQVTIFTEMSALAQKHNAINLGQGFPDFDPPEELLSLVKYYTTQQKNQYAPMAGVLQLRQALSKKIYDSYGKYYDPNTEITITAGATQAIFTFITALVHPGDEVIIFEPAYDSYIPSIVIAGGKPIVYAMQAPEFSIDWQHVRSLITDRTRLLIINTPHNPTGTILKQKDLLQIENMADQHDLIVLSDEVYEHLVYDGNSHESASKYPRLSSRSVSIFSFGKTFHATGWKMGYIVGPEYLMAEFRKIHQWNVFSVNSFLQYALADYLSNPNSYNYLSEFYQNKRDHFVNILTETPFKVLSCNGTYFQLVDYSDISNLDDRAFCNQLIEYHGVATIPLSPFYSKQEDSKWIRFCFAKTDSLLDAAKEKLIRLNG